MIRFRVKSPFFVSFEKMSIIRIIYIRTNLKFLDPVVHKLLKTNFSSFFLLFLLSAKTEQKAALLSLKIQTP